MDIGTLTIQMAANVARIQTDMDATKRIVGGAMKDVEQYVGYAKQAFVALTGVAGVSAFVGMISGAIEAKARLYDLSLQTGISVEALASLGKVAKYSNTQLEDVATGSNKLSKALYTTNEDSKGAARGIEALGLNFQQLKAMKPDEQMLAVAKAMAQFEEGSGKAATAQLLFGKAGAQLLPFLKELAERGMSVTKETTAGALAAKQYEDNLITLRAAGDEWKKQLVNDILPSLVSVTKELVDGRKAYGGYFSAILDIGLNVNPFASLNENITATVTKFRELDEEAAKIKQKQGAGGFIASLTKGLDEQRLADIKEEQATLDKRLVYLRAQQNDGSAGGGRGKVNPGDKPLGKLDVDTSDRKTPKDDYTPLIKSIREKIAADQAEYESVEKLTAAQQLQVRVHEDIASGYITLTPEQKKNVEALLQQLLAVDQLNVAKAKEAKWIEETRKQTEAALEVQQQHIRAIDQQVLAFDDSIEAFGKTREQLQALDAARDRDASAQLRQRAAMLDTVGPMGQLRDLYLQQAEALDRLAIRKDTLAAKEAREANDAAAGASRAVREYLTYVERAGDATARVVGDSIAGLEDGLSGLAARKKFDVTAWVDQIIQEMFRLAVVKPLLAEIFGGGGAGQGGGWVGAAATAIGAMMGWGSSLTVDTAGMGTNLTGGAVPTAGGRAGGGDVRAGQTYIVGEDGPERLRMGDSNGSITPNGGASRPVTLNVMYNGQPAKASASQRDTPNGTIVDLILDTVAGDVEAGGRVAGAHERRFGLNGAAGTTRS